MVHLAIIMEEAEVQVVAVQVAEELSLVEPALQAKDMLVVLDIPQLMMLVVPVVELVVQELVELCQISVELGESEKLIPSLEQVYIMLEVEVEELRRMVTVEQEVMVAEEEEGEELLLV